MMSRRVVKIYLEVLIELNVTPLVKQVSSSSREVPLLESVPS